MASPIKGITIELDGNTEKLDTALKNTNSAARDTETQLRSVEKALKMDPGNTDLLAEKQKLLTDRVSETKDKLNVLQTASDQCAEKMKSGDEGAAQQYEALQTEIAKTKAELGDLETKAASANATLSKIGDVAGTISDKTGKMGSALMPVTAAVGATAGAAVASFNELDEGYDTIIEKTGATGQAAEDLQNSMNNVFGSMPTDAATAGTAIGEINTRFGLTGEKLETLSGDFIKFGEINQTDVNASIGETQKIMSQWNVSTDDATKVLGLFTSASQKSGVGVDELMSTVQEKGSVFKEMGLGLGESVNMLAQFEQSGVNSDVAVKAMQKSIASYMTDNKALDKTIQGTTDKIRSAKDETAAIKVATDKLGKNYSDGSLTGEAAIKKLVESVRGAKDETTALDTTTQAYANNGRTATTDIAGAFNQSVTAIKNAKSDTEALQIATQTFGNKGAAEMTKAIREGRLSIDDLSGSIDQYGSTVTDTFEATEDPPDKAKVALNNLKLAGADLGNSILQSLVPMIDKAVSKAKEIQQWFSSLSDSQKDQIIKIGLIIAAIAPALLAISKVAKGIQDITNVIKVARPVIAAMNATMAANPIILIIAAIVAVIAILVVMYNKCAWFRDGVNAIFGAIKTAFFAVFDAIKNFFTVTLPQVLNAFLTFVTGYVQLQIAVYRAVWDGIVAIFSVVGTFFRNVFTAGYNAVTSIFSGIGQWFAARWNDIKTVFSVVISFYYTIFSGAYTAIKNVFMNIGQWFSARWQDIKAVFSAVGTFFYDKFTAAYTQIKNVFQNIGQWFSARWTDIKAVFSSVGTFFYDKFSEAYENIKKVFSNIGTFFSGIWTTVKGVFTNFGVQVGEAMGAAFKSAMNAAITTVENAINGAIGIINGAIDLINMIPGVSVGHVGNVGLPRLASGGILSNGSAIIAEAGPELLSMVNGQAIVTPLTDTAQNTAVGQQAGTGYTQNINITSPKALSPYETAIQTRNATRNMVLQLRKARA
jgi:phage-related minor tail protein